MDTQTANAALAPDPGEIRAATLEELAGFGVPLPPEEFPLVWDPGDRVALRATGDLADRAAVLHLLLARVFGMPPADAIRWLMDGRLLPVVTPPEFQFVSGQEGDRDAFALHIEALFALSWTLGLVDHLDPSMHCADGLTGLFPDLEAGESHLAWRAESDFAPVESGEAAALLDMYYCLDWAYQDARRRHEPAPGPVEPYVIGQRRWALEWAVVFTGPYHEEPPGWEDVDLSV